MGPRAYARLEVMTLPIGRHDLLASASRWRHSGSVAFRLEHECNSRQRPRRRYVPMKNSRKKWVAGAVATAMFATQLGVGAPRSHAAPGTPSVVAETPIEHVIVLIGENRSFDHTFATYEPRNGQSIASLLSKGI